MAEPQAAEADAGSAAGTSKLPMILALANTFAILAAAGALTYTRLLYKRPVITEASERAHIMAMQAAPKVPPKTGYVNFKAQTVNIAPSPLPPKTADGSSSQPLGKLHYATIGFSLELSDISRKAEVEAIRPLILDKFLSIVGRKQFQDLTSVQGRYVLKTQILEAVNKLAAKRLPGSKTDSDPLAIDLFFTRFIVQ